MQFIPSIVENWGFLRDGVSGYTCVSLGYEGNNFNRQKPADIGLSPACGYFEI